MRIPFSLSIPFFHRHGGVRLSRLVHPAREWFTSLLVVLVFLIVGLSYSAHLFITQIQTDYLAAELTNAQPEAYKHGAVEKALSTYRTRKDMFDQLRSAPVVLPLPIATTTSPVAEGTQTGVE